MSVISKRAMLYLLILPATLFHAATALTQESLDNVDSSLRRYTTEIIIFSYNQEVSIGSEVFIADPPPDDIGFDQLTEIEVSVPMPAPAEIVLLNENDFTMNEIFDRLQRLDVYKPLMHFGWTQVTQADIETRSQPLSFFATPPPGLDGELTLYLSRFLHLVVDLQLAGPNSPPASRDYSRDSDWAYPITYRLSENRIIRNGELRYFDHPKFGVLAKITRVEESEEEELLGE